MKNTYDIGLKNFATNFFNLQKTIPNTRAIKVCDLCKFRKAEHEIIYTETKDYICNECKEKLEGFRYE